MQSVAIDKVSQAIFDALNRHLGGGLELLDFFDSGSTARVYRVSLPVGGEPTLRVDRIVKVFRHDGDILAFPDIEAIFHREVRTLLSTSHTNLISIYSAGVLPLESSRSTPFYVMEYLPGAQDLDQWILSNAHALKQGSVVELLLQAAQGILALHQAGVLHCDVKVGNLLVGDGGRVKVADLGFSKEIRGGTADTGMHTTLEPLPDRYKNFLTELQDPRRISLRIPRNQLDFAFDLHYFGRVVRRLLQMPVLEHHFDPLERASLTLVVERTNLDATSLLPPYASMDVLVADLGKLMPSSINRIGLRELSSYTGTRTIRIPVTGSIPFSRRVQDVISHPLFLRLHNALQLGFTYFVFPGATHSRFEHCLGVFANVGRYVSSLLADDHQPYFRQLVGEEHIETALLAGLVHDVGQNSFAHSLEDLGLVPAHEQVSASFITGEGLQDLVPDRLRSAGPLASVIAGAWPAINQARLLWMITRIRPAGMSRDLGWEVMQSIVDGPVDADKTDYLLRDAHHAGVEYARSIDITRFMNSLTAAVVKEEHCPRGVVAITWKGAQSAENIMLARSQMFWVLYWHHAVRAAHAMLGEAAYEHLRDADEQARIAFWHVLYSGTTGELLALLERSPSLRARGLATLLRVRQLFKRGIALDFRDDEQLYRRVLRLKRTCVEARDLLLKDLARGIVEEANRVFADNRSNARLTENDVLIDVPKEAKDRLGAIYVVDRDNQRAREYTSRAMIGTTEDWENRVRTIRVFVTPELESRDLELLRRHGRQILSDV